MCMMMCVCLERKMGRGVSRVHGVSVRLADRSSAPETNPCMNKSIKPYLCSVCVRWEGTGEHHMRMRAMRLLVSQRLRQ